MLVNDMPLPLAPSCLSKQQKQSRREALCCLLFSARGPSCAGSRLSSRNSGCFRVILVNPLSSYFSFFHSPSLAGSLSLRLPRSLARVRECWAAPGAAAFSTGHPAHCWPTGPCRPTPCWKRAAAAPTPSSYRLTPPTRRSPPPLSLRPSVPAPVPCKLSHSAGFVAVVPGASRTPG